VEFRHTNSKQSLIYDHFFLNHRLVHRSRNGLQNWLSIISTTIFAMYFLANLALERRFNCRHLWCFDNKWFHISGYRRHLFQFHVDKFKVPQSTLNKTVDYYFWDNIKLSKITDRHSLKAVLLPSNSSCCPPVQSGDDTCSQLYNKQGNYLRYQH
jgi:hypothetical protein